MGADFIDYIVADRFVIPEDQHSSYREKIVYLPDCYLANDSKRVIGGDVPTRLEAGLPETGFVFCSFNKSNKITPPYSTSGYVCCCGWKAAYCGFWRATRPPSAICDGSRRSGASPQTG